MDKRHARKGYWPIKILYNRNSVHSERHSVRLSILDNFCFRVALELEIVLYVSIRKNKPFCLSPCARPRCNRAMKVPSQLAGNFVPHMARRKGEGWEGNFFEPWNVVFYC